MNGLSLAKSLTLHMKAFLKDILVDPNTKRPLIFDNTTQKLLSPNQNNVYEIIEEIPIVLPKIQSEHIQTDQLHQQFSSEFAYQEHYQKDAELFDYFAPYESAATRHEIRRLHEAILTQVPPNAQLILDVGCGNGWVAQHFSTKDVHLISMDISKNNPTRVMQQFPGHNHSGLVADVFHLPIKKNSIDCIIASEIIEHVPDPKLFIQKLLEVLKPGGQLIISTPYKEKIEYYLCVHCNKMTPKNAHLHSFDEAHIKSIVPKKNIHLLIQTMNNMILIKLRTHLLLQHLPYSVWKWIDQLSNHIINKASRLIISIQKLQ